MTFTIIGVFLRKALNSKLSEVQLMSREGATDFCWKNTPPVVVKPGKIWTNRYKSRIYQKIEDETWLVGGLNPFEKY